MFLNKWNIITTRLFKKLNDKMLNSFQIINSVDSFYKLKLSETMHIHDIFHSELQADQQAEVEHELLFNFWVSSSV